MPCRAPALFRQYRVLRECPHGSRKYPNCQPNSITDHLFCSALLTLFSSSMQTVFGFTPATCIGHWYASDNNFVELRVVTGRSRTQASSPQAISRLPCCAVALRRTTWSGMAWARHGKCESETAALCKSNGKDTF